MDSIFERFKSATTQPSSVEASKSAAIDGPEICVVPCNVNTPSVERFVGIFSPKIRGKIRFKSEYFEVKRSI